MSPRFQSRNTAINDEAIQWLVCMAGSPTAAEQAAFGQWCRRSPAHAQALQEAQALLADIGATASAGEHRQLVQVLGRPRAPRISRRRLLAGGLSAAAVAGVAGAGLLAGGERWLADYRTGVGQRQALTLPDGSRAWLNTGSALSLRFAVGQRGLQLQAGELFVDVRPDARLPALVVQLPGAMLYSHDARFSVRLRARSVVLTVLAGVVELRSPAATLQVAANQQLACSDEVAGQVLAVDADAVTAWVRGKLIFHRQALAAMAEEVERYVHGRIMVVGTPLQQLRLSGVFALDDTEALLRSVAEVSGAELLRLPLLSVLR